MSLEIKVCGQAGTGKTVAARIIALALRDAGFNVWINVDECDELVTKERFEKCRKTLQGSEVKVSCIQTPIELKGNHENS